MAIIVVVAAAVRSQQLLLAATHTVVFPASTPDDDDGGDDDEEQAGHHTGRYNNVLACGHMHWHQSSGCNIGQGLLPSRGRSAWLHHQESEGAESRLNARSLQPVGQLVRGVAGQGHPCRTHKVDDTILEVLLGEVPNFPVAHRAWFPRTRSAHDALDST